MTIPFKISANNTINVFLHQTNFEEFFPEVNTNTSWKTLKPYIEQAIEEYILPLVGEALYEDLLAKYHANTTLSAQQAKALRHLQVASAWYSVAYAYYNKLDIMSNLGNVQNSADKSIATPQWAADKKYGNLLRTADKKMDMLLEYLELQKDSNESYFDLWYNDKAYQKGKSDLFYTTEEVQKYHNIQNSRRTFLALLPALRDVARFHIIPCVGLNMYNEIVVQNDSGEMTPANVLLIEYMRAAAIKLAIASALETQPIIFEADGIRSVSTTLGVEKFHFERLQNQVRACNELGKKYLQELDNFIFNNAEAYPTYKQSSAYPASTSKASSIIASSDGVGAIMF